MDSQSNIILGLGEAAELAGCSRDTIRRAAQKGELKAEMGPGIRGPQWWISRLDLLSWLEGRDVHSEYSNAIHKEAQHSSKAQYDGEEHSNAAQDRSTAPSAAAHKDPELSSAPQQGLADFAVSNSPPAEVYIALIDRLTRAERRSIELELTLRQSQRLLSENAESITEKEALAAQVKAQLQEAEEARWVESKHYRDKEAKLKEAESMLLLVAQTKQAEAETLARKLVEAQEAQESHQAAEQSNRLEVDRLRSELETTRLRLLEAQKPKGLLSWLGLRKKRNISDKAEKFG